MVESDAKKESLRLTWCRLSSLESEIGTLNDRELKCSRWEVKIENQNIAKSSNWMTKIGSLWIKELKYCKDEKLKLRKKIGRLEDWKIASLR